MSLSRYFPLIEARAHDPFALLGNHAEDDLTRCYTTYQPHAACVAVATKDGQWLNIPAIAEGIFRLSLADGILPTHPALQITPQDQSAEPYTIIDPYSFAPLLGELDLHLFAEGNHYRLWEMLGAHPQRIDDIDGVRFSVWAPNACRVSVVGDFNNWDGRRHPMRARVPSGVWELFIPGLTSGDFYKFEIKNRDSGDISVRTDPVGQSFELRPNTAAIVTTETAYSWQDSAWMHHREQTNWRHAPMSIYEVHLGSWQQDSKEFLNYRTLASRLIPYLQEQGFTHIELLPITEHPFDGSWGYQTTGYYAPTARFGTPDDFRFFVDQAHQAGIGVILDWVPAHFPRDHFALARFDGTALYEHEDPRRGEHRDWGTLIFNYGRNEVRNFLIGSALFWLEEMHIDGLRVDAVASMLYLDYSREAGDWLPNAYGGRENIEAIDFLRQLNHTTHTRVPGSMIMAEESTAWPLVSRPPEVGGLGFTMKWNMGWMNDTLRYFQEDPIHRQYHHNNLTFGLLYSFNENFILPFSHDEVVHGKGSLLNKMPGDEWQRFANLRLLLAYQFTYPGKKLLFMGCEFGQGNEWNHETSLDWWVLQFPFHQGIQKLSRALNHLYRAEKSLHIYDFDPKGFNWNDCNDRQHSIISFYRHSEHETTLTILNFTPVVRINYAIGIPADTRLQVLLNTDAAEFGGNDTDLALKQHPDAPHHGHPAHLRMTLPALSAIVLKIR